MPHVWPQVNYIIRCYASLMHSCLSAKLVFSMFPFLVTGRDSHSPTTVAGGQKWYLITDPGRTDLFVQVYAIVLSFMHCLFASGLLSDTSALFSLLCDTTTSPGYCRSYFKSNFKSMFKLFIPSHLTIVIGSRYLLSAVDFFLRQTSWWQAIGYLSDSVVFGLFKPPTFYISLILHSIWTSAHLIHTLRECRATNGFVHRVQMAFHSKVMRCLLSWQHRIWIRMVPITWFDVTILLPAPSCWSA